MRPVGAMPLRVRLSDMLGVTKRLSFTSSNDKTWQLQFSHVMLNVSTIAEREPDPTVRKVSTPAAGDFRITERVKDWYSCDVVYDKVVLPLSFRIVWFANPAKFEPRRRQTARVFSL